MSAPRRGSVSFDGVWKRFHRGDLHDSLRDLIPSLGRRLMRRSTRRAKSDREFWALRDVSFRVAPGEVLGIIGPNGAGKSTTLKILTGIIEPTRGHYRVDGRVGALLEVAAGFHPDLTGRENVFLQGAIMGMSQRDITARFDDIVAFAGVPEFIDTPVKRYSSGMNARLGFAIAVHLDPDVLIIDEVLAVGDFAFQQQAFDRIQRVVKSGVPVVIVSHQLERVASLCTRAMLLDHGAVRKEGTPQECIMEYVSGSTQHPAIQHPDIPVELFPLRINPEPPVVSGQPISIQLRGRLLGPLGANLDACALRVVSADTGREVFATSAHECGIEPPHEPGEFVVNIDIQLNVPPGVYLVESSVVDWTSWQHVLIGPLTYLQVGKGPPFRGTIQMHARMQLASPVS